VHDSRCNGHVRDDSKVQSEETWLAEPERTNSTGRYLIWVAALASLENTVNAEIADQMDSDFLHSYCHLFFFLPCKDWFFLVMPPSPDQ
jgi:hypothetical protein